MPFPGQKSFLRFLFTQLVQIIILLSWVLGESAQGFISDVYLRVVSCLRVFQKLKIKHKLR